jgi:hypothetical protein
MEFVYITGIIVFGIVIIVLAFRDRITDLVFGVSEKQGDRERKGDFRVKAAHPQRKSKNRNESDKSYAVDIRGNTRIGIERTKVSRDGVRIADNKSIGETNIEIKGDHDIAEQLPLPNTQEIQAQLQEKNSNSDGLHLEQQSILKKLPEVKGE